jgi:hypothetical protein
MIELARGERLESREAERQQIAEETKNFTQRGGKVTRGCYVPKAPTGPKAVDLNADAQAILRDVANDRRAA